MASYSALDRVAFASGAAVSSGRSPDARRAPTLPDMRAPVDPQRLRRFMRELGWRARGPGRIYLTGGATALLVDAFRRRVRGFLGASDQ